MLITINYRTTRKLVQYFAEVLEEERDKLIDNLVVGNSKFKIFKSTKFFRGYAYLYNKIPMGRR